MVRESECFLDGLKRNCDGRSDGRSAQNQVNVGRDILYLNKVEKTHGHLSNIHKSQEPWINQQNGSYFLSFQTMVYYEWNSAVILDEVELQEVDLEMEPLEPHKFMETLGLVIFLAKMITGMW